MADSKVISSNNCMQVQIFRRVTTFPRSGKDKKLSPWDGRKRFRMIRNNPETTKAQACHSLETADLWPWVQGHQDSNMSQIFSRCTFNINLILICHLIIKLSHSDFGVYAACTPGWQQYPNSPLPLRSKNLNQNSLTPEETVLICFKGFNKYQLSQKLPVIPTRQPL